MVSYVVLFLDICFDVGIFKEPTLHKLRDFMWLSTFNITVARVKQSTKFQTNS